MAIDTIEKVDNTVECIADKIEESGLLEDMLKEDSLLGRYRLLDRYLCSHAKDFCTDIVELKQLQINDMVYLNLQERSGLDMGMCQYFIPNYREMAKAMLDGQWVRHAHKCCYSGMITDCTGVLGSVDGNDICRAKDLDRYNSAFNELQRSENDKTKH